MPRQHKFLLPPEAILIATLAGYSQQDIARTFGMNRQRIALKAQALGFPTRVLPPLPATDSLAEWVRHCRQVAADRLANIDAALSAMERTERLVDADAEPEAEPEAGPSLEPEAAMALEPEAVSQQAPARKPSIPTYLLMGT